MRTIYCCHSLGSDTEKAFRPSAPLRRRVTKVGLDVTLGFQTVERGIDGADRDFTPRACFDLLPHCDPVSVITKAQKSQDSDVFKFA